MEGVIEVKQVVFGLFTFLLLLLSCISVSAFNPTGVTISPSTVLLRDGSITVTVEGTGVEQMKVVLKNTAGTVLYESYY